MRKPTRRPQRPVAAFMGKILQRFPAAISTALLGAFLLFSGSAFAQVPGSGINFQGPATPGDCPQIVNAGTQKDSGSPCGSGSSVSSLSFGSTGLTPNSATTGAITVAGTLGFANGGTGQTAYTNGQLLIGNTLTGGLSLATLTQGSGVTITNGNGTITIAATGSGGCATSGSATDVLTDNGSGGCTSNTTLTFATGTLSLGTNTSLAGAVKMFGSTSGDGTLTFPAIAGTSSKITFPAGITNFSATGGASEVIEQTSTGAAFTVARLACADLSNAGTACTAATGTSGATVPLLNGANTWTGVQTFTNSDIKLLGSSTGASTFTSANSGASNFTLTFPATTTTMAGLGVAETWTALQTFTNSDICLLGSSTGCTTFTSANAGVSNFTLTFPAATDTLVTLAASQTLTNKTLTSPALGGSVTGANTIPLSILAQIGTNTVLGNATSGTANVTALSVGTCSGATNALIWTTNIGFGCNTISGSGGAYPSWGGDKTTAFNATSGVSYGVDTATTGAVTATLPATPADGDQIRFLDSKQNWGTTTFTVNPNGNTIMGQSGNMTVTRSNSSFTMQWDATANTWLIW